MDALLRLGSIWVWLLVALALITLLVVVILSTVVRRSAEEVQLEEDREKKRAKPAVAPAEEETPEPAAAAAAPVRIEPAGMSFNRALSFLKRAVTGYDYRYQIPWYLVVGDPGSGKRTVLEATGVNLAPAEGPLNVRRSLTWRFLDDGILIAASGAYFKGGSLREEYDWTKLLRLFQNHRTRRPLDGIILTIAATDLLGPTALDETQLSARAARFSEMLAQAQKTLGFTFPVYVIVTKCDEIEGYRGFCRELPSRTTDDVFGWSSPYHLDASFTADWVDEAFNAVGDDLQRLQTEVFVERSEVRAPEDVFLFPEEFAQLRPPLRVYLERLFRETAYREAFRFRGLYFCGDLTETPPPAAPVLAEGEEEEDAQWSATLASLEPPPPPPLPAKKKPSYVKNLFAQKIFPESGIARPLSRVFLAKSRSVRLIQASAGALALILGLGLWLSYRALASDRDKLMPGLRMMGRAPDGRGLLLALAPAGDVRLRSVFMPQSLFASTDDDVTKVMTYACNRWILNALRDSLIQRKDAILATGAKPSPVAAKASTAAGDGESQTEDEPLSVENIDATPSFQELERFINSLAAFQENRTIYENLRRSGQVADVERMRKLLGYLGISDVQPAGHLAAALRAATALPVDVTAEDRAAAAEIIKRDLGAMLQTWFESNPLLDHVQQFKQAIVDVEQGRSESYNDLKNTLAWANQVDSDLSSPVFKWASSPTLDLSGPLQRVSTNPIDPGSRVVADYARQIGEGYLTKLRKELSDQRTTMTDALVTKDPFALSPGARQLQLALENTMNLRFMSNAVREPRSIRITLNEKTRLIWRVEPIQEALRLDEIYTQFTNDGLRGAPRQLAAVLRRVALNQLKKNIQDLVAQAQDFPARSVAQDRNGEDQTLPEVNSFRDAEGPLLQLAAQLQGLAAVDIRNSILRILVLQSHNLLDVLDQRLQQDAPYSAKPGNWRGKGSVSLANFELRNASVLNDYLTAQRSRIKFLEQQAEPLVPFLNTWLPVRGEAQTRLISKWQQIIEDFQQYEAKKPGASLTALEDFVLSGLDKITPENSCGAAENITSRDHNVDYFIGVRNRLLGDATERCRDIAAEAVCVTYAGIATQFNSTLGGNFPFARLTVGKAQPEATPEAISSFYQLLEQNGKVARSALREDQRFSAVAPAALAFLDRMEQLKPLVTPAAADAPKEPPLTLDFVPRFRVNRRNETAGNQIIDWTMQVGGQLYRQREAEHPGRWRPGYPVRLSLRWANDSILIPSADGAQPYEHIGERSAFFEFTNRWALFALLRQLETQPSEIAQSTDTDPYVLRLRVKTARDPKWVNTDPSPATGTTTVYLQMKVMLPGSKNAITVPPFPFSAPTLGAACGRE